VPARSIDAAPATRHLLRNGWELCATAPGECAAPEALASAARQWIAAIVPGTVAEALQAAGLWSLDGAERRFDAEDWWYRLRFDAPENLDPATAILEFDGLATLCEIWLNGDPLPGSDNMYLSQSVPVHGLRRQGNELQLVFRSLDAALKKRRPRPRWRAPMIENQQLRWYRTTVLGRTPGWSPPAAAVGPWRPIALRAGSPGIELLQLRAELVADAGVLHFEARLHESGLQQLTMELRSQEALVASAPVNPDSGVLRASLRVDGVTPWFPHTHGEPALYEAVLRATGTQGRGREFILGRVGFRGVQQQSSAPDGFGLAINGTKIFCRGACWTPLDIVALRADVAGLRRALEQVVSAGFNMLRISGAFLYEEEDFFALCDELGILVWQEFMFANMDYPAADQAFMDSVRQEAAQHLQCWSRHPCVVVICGNSEVSQQAAMWGSTRDLWSPRVFEETLRTLAAEHCPGTPYWPSSACGGDLPHQVDAGTSSYYGVGAYLRGYDDLRRSGLRFATECLGFANVPEIDTLETLPGGSAIRVHHPAWKRRAPRDLGAGWDFDDVRDHYLRQLFNLDPLQLRYADHARYLEISRRVPAEVMAAAFTEWRRPGSTCDGALVWFLRDLWAGAGWGIIDSRGEPKAPYHALRQLLQPQWIGITDEGLNGLAIHVGNEFARALDGELDLALYRDGQQLVTRARREVTLEPRASRTIAAASLLAGFHDLTHAYRFGPLSCDLVVATLNRGAEEPALQAFYLPYPHLHSAPHPACTLTAQARPGGVPGEYVLTVRSSAFARSVHVDAPGYAADTQYFNLAPGAELELALRARSPTPAALLGSVTALNANGAARIETIA